MEAFQPWMKTIRGGVELAAVVISFCFFTVNNRWDEDTKQ